MENSRRSQGKALPWLALGLVLTGSAIIYCWNLDYGLPFFPRSDEVHCVPYTLTEGQNVKFYNFRYPGLSKKIYYIPKLIAGWDSDSPHIVLAARYVSVLFSLFSLLTFFVLARSLIPRHGDWIALAGTVGLATHPLFVASARSALAESILLCFLLWFFLAIVRFIEKPGRRRLLLAAVLLGLLVGAKYSGVFLSVALATAVFMHRRYDLRRAFVDFAAVGTVVTAAFVVTTPRALLYPQRFLNDFLWNNKHYAAGHPGLPTDGVWLDYVQSLGVLPVVLGCLSLPLWYRQHPRSFTVLVPWALLYFVKLSGYRMGFERNMLIVVPVLFLAACFAMSSPGPFPPRWGKLLFLAFFAVALAGQASLAYRHGYWHDRPSTLDVGYREINDHIPRRATVWRSMYTPPIHPPRTRVGTNLDRDVVEAFVRGEIEYVVLSESFTRRIRPGTFGYETGLELLERLEEAGELTLHIADSSELIGPGIRVYRSSLAPRDQ